MQSRIRQPPSELIRAQAAYLDATSPLSAAHSYGQISSELSNNYYDPSGIQLSFKTPASGHLPTRWDAYQEDDDYSDDGNSDRESSSSSLVRHQPPSRLLPTYPQSPMFDASRPYLCNSSVIDRMCATFGHPSNASASHLDRFAINCDQLTIDSESGGVIQPQFVAQSVDHAAGLKAFISADPMDGERIIVDSEVEQLASEDETFRDTESQSPVVEEDSWQCVVEDGEVELT